MSGLRSDLRRVVAGHTAAGATAMSAMVAAVVPAFSVALAAQAPPPPPPSAAAAWCPTYHTIKDHYDPSGPSYEPTTEIWHVFPDTAGSVDGDDADKVCNHGWCHLFSKDLLRWHVQNETAAGGFPLANGDTGSISFTENGTIALFPTTKGAFGLLRQVPAGGGPLTPRMTWTNASHVYSATFDGARAGFRDPARALKMADGSYYVAVGAGVGKEGCIAWLRAGDASLTSFEFVGCLLSTNHTTGHMDTQHYGWDPKDLKVSFIECPDVFKLGSKYIALGSFNDYGV
jgi:sucrose-6-phosphate hydrolase SacC (GH32 family)